LTVCKCDLAGIRALVVDDDADGRDLLQLAFEQEGGEVRTVGTARRALEILKQWRPHVLVSDIALPGEDGYHLLRRVRELPAEEGGTTPAIALSGYTSPEDRICVMEAGFQVHVAKPVEPSRMVQIIRQLVADGISATEV